MAFLTTERVTAPSPGGALTATIRGWLDTYQTHRRRRDVYLRTLRELQSYRPHELHDLRVQSADFEELARKQAGW